jgi:GT2 family glycosyltransferase
MGHEISSVTVVDDGSQPKLELALGEFTRPVALYRNQENCGRSAARNKGASIGEAPAFLFLDSDLVLASPGTLQILLDCLKERGGMVQGWVKEVNSPFWVWYQDSSVGRKLEQCGPNWAGTTAFVGLLRADFERLKGFDESFKGYGFEDRDFLYRAHCAGIPIARVRSAVAEHDGDKSVKDLEHKLYDAGRRSAPLFRRKHAQAYEELPYAKIDFHGSPFWLRRCVILTYRASSFIARPFLVSDRIPRFLYRLRRHGIRFLLALAFAAGTSEAGPSNSRGFENTERRR